MLDFYELFKSLGGKWQVEELCVILSENKCPKGS